MISTDGIERLVEPVLEGLGLALYGAELKREGRQLVLRLVVDRRGKASAQDGVTVDELAKASNEVGALLDLENPIEERYRLTLESPGIERELNTWRQFEYAVGERVRVVTRGQESRVLEGRLMSADEARRTVAVETPEGVVEIEFGEIKSARTVFLWEEQSGQKTKF